MIPNRDFDVVMRVIFHRFSHDGPLFDNRLASSLEDLHVDIPLGMGLDIGQQ